MPTTSKKPTRPSGLVIGPSAVETLRQVAVHRETARLLDLCAARERDQRAADLLHHRAAQRRERADRLAASLYRQSAERRHPSSRG